VMLDLIYSDETQRATDDPVGQQILEYARNRPAPQAVKHRRERLAQLIDKTVKRNPQARILVLAAGHLREVELACTLGTGFSGEIVALDQDAESLALIEREYGELGVRTVHASIRRVIAGQLDLGRFDLVYAAGLFDYLDQPVARSLVKHMFGMLRPGGEAMVANFLTGIEDVGYMESFMDWHLIYRNHAQMLDLAADVAQDELARVDLDFDAGRNIGYLSLSKPVH
jgi:extracellular factor (EF) 3-hydroxypalmitic acid methyl ester biosynthesis protein